MSPAEAHKAALLAAHRIRWRLGFNDPTIAGWLAVAGYALTAVLAWRAGARARRAGLAFDRRFWWLACAALVLLGANKQLDLQVLVTDIGRWWAVESGWYRERRTFQKAFMLAGAAAAALALAGGFLATRGRAGAIRLALLGLAIAGGYILIRAASFHHTDVLMRTDTLGGRWSWFMELAGIAITAIAAWRYRPG